MERSPGAGDRPLGERPRRADALRDLGANGLERHMSGAQGEETSVSLAHVVGDALASRGEAITATQIELHRTVAPACVAGSETLLARMVDNLIDNAVRHNVPGGLINVSCELIGTRHDWWSKAPARS
jgi:signal transduction histidine kinase